MESTLGQDEQIMLDSVDRRTTAKRVLPFEDELGLR